MRGPHEVVARGLTFDVELVYYDSYGQCGKSSLTTAILFPHDVPRDVVDPLSTNDRLNVLAGHLNAVHAAIVDLVAEALADESWGGDGVRTPQQWLSWQLGITTARSAPILGPRRRRRHASGRVGPLRRRSALAHPGIDRHVGRRDPRRRDRRARHRMHDQPAAPVHAGDENIRRRRTRTAASNAPPSAPTRAPTRRPRTCCPTRIRASGGRRWSSGSTTTAGWSDASTSTAEAAGSSTPPCITPATCCSTNTTKRSTRHDICASTVAG